MNFLDYEIGLPKLWGKVKGIVPEPETDENVSALLTQMVNTGDEALSAEQLASIEDELVDVREGTDGTKYASAGDAVRGQVSALKEDLKKTFKDEVPFDDMITGKFIDSRSGLAQNSEDSKASDYISVYPGHTLILSSLYLESYRSACAYDRNKNFTRAIAVRGDEVPKKVTLAENEYYIRVTGTLTTKPKIEYADDDGFVIVETSKQHDFNASITQPTDINMGELIANSFISGVDGSVQYAEDSSVTDFIQIQPGASIKINSLYLQGNRSVCAYDVNKQFTRKITETTAAVQILQFDPGEFYFRATCKTTQSSAFRAERLDNFINNALIDQDRYSNYYSDNIKVTADDFSPGYINYDGISIIDSASYVHTGYIEVIGGTKIVLKGFVSAVLRYLFVYDDEYKLVDMPIAPSSAYVEYYEYTLPYVAKYIRFNALTSSYEQNAALSYYTINHKHEKADFYANYLCKILNTANNDLNRLFARAMPSPTITLIDDDTLNLAAITKYHNSCIANGVKGGYAVLTQKLENDPQIKNLLLDYESEGFSMNIHAYSQISAYNRGTARDIAEAEANFVKGLRQMRDFGFVDYNYWCTPFGVSDNDIQGIAKRHGIKCLIRSGINAYVGSERISRYAIPRASLNPNSDALTQCKNLVDKCVQNKGWLLITTHFYESGWDSTSIFDEFIQYALSKGCVFKTISEAWTERKYIFDLYDTF